MTQRKSFGAQIRRNHSFMQNFRPHSDKFGNGKQCRRLIRLSVYVFARVDAERVACSLRAHYLFFACARSVDRWNPSCVAAWKLQQSGGENVFADWNTHMHTHTEHYGIHLHTQNTEQRTQRQSWNYVGRRFKMQLMESDVIRVTRSQNKGLRQTQRTLIGSWVSWSRSDAKCVFCCARFVSRVCIIDSVNAILITYWIGRRWCFN